jgi:hypothetical protein
MDPLLRNTILRNAAEYSVLLHDELIHVNTGTGLVIAIVTKKNHLATNGNQYRPGICATFHYGLAEYAGNVSPLQASALNNASFILSDGRTMETIRHEDPYLLFTLPVQSKDKNRACKLNKSGQFAVAVAGNDEAVNANIEIAVLRGMEHFMRLLWDYGRELGRTITQKDLSEFFEKISTRLKQTKRLRVPKKALGSWDDFPWRKQWEAQWTQPQHPM